MLYPRASLHSSQITMITKTIHWKSYSSQREDLELWARATCPSPGAWLPVPALLWCSHLTSNETAEWPVRRNGGELQWRVSPLCSEPAFKLKHFACLWVLPQEFCRNVCPWLFALLTFTWDLSCDCRAAWPVGLQLTMVIVTRPDLPFPHGFCGTVSCLSVDTAYLAVTFDSWLAFLCRSGSSCHDNKN